jgi:hypothetical protein
MTWGRCVTCKATGFMEHHRCPPAWQVLAEYHNGDWDDALVVYAQDADDAVKVAAERIDGGDAEGPSEQVLLVRPLTGDGEVRRFAITFDYSVNYYACEEPADVDAATEGGTP